MKLEQLFEGRSGKTETGRWEIRNGKLHANHVDGADVWLTPEQARRGLEQGASDVEWLTHWNSPKSKNNPPVKDEAEFEESDFGAGITSIIWGGEFEIWVPTSALRDFAR